MDVIAKQNLATGFLKVPDQSLLGDGGVPGESLEINRIQFGR